MSLFIFPSSLLRFFPLLALQGFVYNRRSIKALALGVGSGISAPDIPTRLNTHTHSAPARSGATNLGPAPGSCGWDAGGAKEAPGSGPPPARPRRTGTDGGGRGGHRPVGHAQRLLFKTPKWRNSFYSFPLWQNNNPISRCKNRKPTVGRRKFAR